MRAAMRPGSWRVRWDSQCFCWHSSDWRCDSVHTQASYLLTVITFLPLFSVAALLVLRSDDHVWIRRIAFAASLGGLPVIKKKKRRFDSTDHGFQSQEL